MHVVELGVAVSEAVGVTVTVLVTKIVVVRGPPAGVVMTSDEKNTPEYEAVAVAARAEDKISPVSEAVDVITGDETARDDAEAVVLKGVEPVIADGHAKPPMPPAD
jgi:hypothetical protein